MSPSRRQIDLANLDAATVARLGAGDLAAMTMEQADATCKAISAWHRDQQRRWAQLRAQRIADEHYAIRATAAETAERLGITPNQLHHVMSQAPAKPLRRRVRHRDG